MITCGSKLSNETLDQSSFHMNVQSSAGVAVGDEEIRSPWILLYAFGPDTRVSQVSLCTEWNSARDSADTASRPFGKSHVPLYTCTSTSVTSPSAALHKPTGADYKRVQLRAHLRLLLGDVHGPKMAAFSDDALVHALLRGGRVVHLAPSTHTPLANLSERASATPRATFLESVHKHDIWRNRSNLCTLLTHAGRKEQMVVQQSTALGVHAMT